MHLSILYVLGKRELSAWEEYSSSPFPPPTKPYQKERYTKPYQKEIYTKLYHIRKTSTQKGAANTFFWLFSFRFFVRETFFYGWALYCISA
jgi:hypothetical protein